MAIATIRLIPNGAAVVHVNGLAFSFSSTEAARAFCVCCDHTWTVVVAPLDLKPPPGEVA